MFSSGSFIEERAAPSWNPLPPPLPSYRVMYVTSNSDTCYDADVSGWVFGVVGREQAGMLHSMLHVGAQSLATTDGRNAHWPSTYFLVLLIPLTFYIVSSLPLYCIN